MHYKVGEPFIPGRTSFPEGAQFTFSRSGIALVFFMDTPSAAELRDYKSPSAQWAWIEREHVGLLCFRFGTQPWSDAPFQAHLVEEWAPPQGNAIQFILVDAGTGLVTLIKLLGWSMEFVQAVTASIHRQLASPYNPDAAQHELDELYRHRTDVLAREHALVRDLGKAKPEAETDAHRNRVDPAAAIARALPGMTLSGTTYHSELAPELARWYCYVPDSGHNILALIKSHLPEERDTVADLAAYTAPLPVRMVQRLGWEQTPEGYLVVDAPYDPTLGVLAEDGDDEF